MKVRFQEFYPIIHLSIACTASEAQGGASGMPAA